MSPLRRPTSPFRTSGFTLMEVLVSMFISAIIMTGVLSSLDSAQKAVDAIHNITLTERAGPQLMEMIRKDIARLAVYDAGEYVIMKGESKSLRGADADRLDMLVYGRSTFPQTHPFLNRHIHAPINEVGYWLREREGPLDFLELYRREDFMVDDEPYGGGNFAMLNDRIVNLDLVYYAKPEFDPAKEDNWDSAQLASLPYCIELHLELEIQPRKSGESLKILGANRSLLEFQDMLVVPEATRWTFRNRLFPQIPGAGGVSDPNQDPTSEAELGDSSSSVTGNVGSGPGR